MSYPNQVSRDGKRFGIFFLFLFFGLGFVITGILNTRLTKEPQTNKSRAQGLSPIQEATCTNKGGECQTGKASQVGKPCSLTDGTAGTIYFNLCPSQPDDIRCCVPNGSPPVNNPPAPQVPVTDSSLKITFQGIGPNANIQNRERSVTIKIFKDDGSLDIADFVAQDSIVYDQTSGTFKSSSFTLGGIPAGKYQMVLQEEKYLDEQLLTVQGEKIINITAGVAVEFAPVVMRAGDIAPGDNGDNSVNIIDYNALIGCLPGAPPGVCLNRNYADLNDDGKVDQVDLDILMSNFGNNGFAFQTEQFKCEPDPACSSGKDTLQLCSLLCTRKSQRS